MVKKDMKIKKIAIISILLLSLCVTFQSSAFASNPTHIDRGAYDIYVTYGQYSVIQVRLWKINMFGDDWPLEGTIDLYSHSDRTTYITFRGSKETSNLGDTAFKVGGEDYRPGSIHNLTFRYGGDALEGYDPCESYVMLHVKYPTAMNVTNLKAGYGENVYLRAKLWNTYNDENLANKNVTFTVYRTIGGARGKAMYVGNAMTDSNGTAVLQYRAPAEDGCIVVASYNGEDLISECSGSGTIKLSRYAEKNTRINVETPKGCNGETTNLTSQLTDSNGVPIANKSLTFRINDEVVGSAVTDQNGTVNLPYKITQTKGTYNVESCFYGDDSSDNCM